MADFCADCSYYVLGAPEGMHDFGTGDGWYLCEGCGMHLFEAGLRLCAPGPWSRPLAMIKPCPACIQATMNRAD